MFTGLRRSRVAYLTTVQYAVPGWVSSQRSLLIRRGNEYYQYQAHLEGLASGLSTIPVLLRVYLILSLWGRRRIRGHGPIAVCHVQSKRYAGPCFTVRANNMNFLWCTKLDAASGALPTGPKKQGWIAKRCFNQTPFVRVEHYYL